MPNLTTVPAGQPIARTSAAHLLATLSPGDLSRAVILVPTRRACVVMRQAFQQELAGSATLLPRMLPLAEIEQVIVSLLGEKELPLLLAIPPAMPESQHRYLLTQQIMAFEKRRGIGNATLNYALTLADALMALQEQCARAGVVLTQENLRALVSKDIADHWRQALLFLAILTDTWPQIEQEFGLMIAATREVALLTLLAEQWKKTPPTMPVIAIGSTGSQASTAQLLKVIADTANGQVILPGLDPTIDTSEWATISAGHPLFHIKSLLDAWPIEPAAVKNLAQNTRNVWREALASTSQLTQWKNIALGDYSKLRLIPCTHVEEEVRVISLLLRESLETPDARVALITPDEGLMARVASMMQRYGITVDRLSAGTLAATQTGSLWAALAATLTSPDALLPLRMLLHHPLLGVDHELLRGLERGWHGVNRRRTGQLPRHEESLRTHPHYVALASMARTIAQLSRQQQSVDVWLAACRALLAPWVKESGQGHEAVEEQLDALGFAESFGKLDSEDFSALLTERLSTKWRDAGIHSHPRIFMLTPVEARMQQFDRVILTNMQESIWPGAPAPNPWLNMASQAVLGLPSAEENISRMAHDMLMLGSSGEVFLTYPKRDDGTPTTRSRFIERLVTLLATHGIAESAITASHYVEWAKALDSSDCYEPEGEARPLPTREQRPRRLPVTDIDKLFTDPFSIYAKHVLGLRKLEDIDASPEAADFGSLAHKAIEALTQHWNLNQRHATAAEIDHIAQHALRDFSERPNVDLFWRARLLNGLRFVNRLEEQRRVEPLEVATEQTVEGDLTLKNGEVMTLHGRIDRLETRNSGTTIIDHKTGAPPKEKEILEGRALQLLAYAMVVNSSAPTESIEYWALPKLGEEGDVLHADLDAVGFAVITEKLIAALAHMLDPQTPFLAHPIRSSGDERYGNDYDGISRWDEWAG